MSVICIRGVIHNFSKLIAIHRQHRNLYGTINNTGRDRLYGDQSYTHSNPLRRKFPVIALLGAIKTLLT